MRTRLFAPFMLSLIIGAAFFAGPGCDDDDGPTGGTNLWIDTVTNVIRDYQYAERRIFDLGLPGELSPGDSIFRLLLFQELQSWTERPTDAAYAILYVDPNQPALYPSENVDLTAIDKGVVPVHPSKYEWFNKPALNLHYLVFPGTPRDLSIGAYMEVKRADGSIDTIGTGLGGTQENPRQLKLIYNKNAVPSFVTWDLMWRNAYSMPQGTSYEAVEIDLFYGPPGTGHLATNPNFQVSAATDTCPFLQIVGLDQYDLSGRKVPDGRVDDRAEIFRLHDWGLLILPHRTPFDTDTTFTHADGSSTPPLDTLVPEIYNYESMTQRAQASRYYFAVTTVIERELIDGGIGDLTLDGVPNTIADAVLFSNYFVYGLGVFILDRDHQVSASDVNRDGRVLTLADLVTLVCLANSEITAPVTDSVAAQVTNAFGTLSVDKPMQAAYVTARGIVEPTLPAQDVDLKYAYDADINITRILVIDMFGGKAFQGDFLYVTSPVLSIELAAPNGAPVKMTYLD